MENIMSEVVKSEQVSAEVVFQSDDFKPNNPPPINLYNQKGGRTRRAIFYSIALMLLVVVSWFLFREFSYVYSLRATVMGDLVNYKAPDMGHITKFYVTDGQKVSKGDPLFEIDTQFYEQKLHQLKIQAKTAEGEVYQAEASLASEKDRRAVFIDASERTLEQLKMSQVAARTQLDLARNVYDRQRKLYQQKAVALEDYQARKNYFDQTAILAKQVDDQIKLQKYVIDQAKQGFYLTTTTSFNSSDPGGSSQVSGIARANFGITQVRDDRPALEVALAQKRSALETINSQITDVEILITKSKVVSKVDGTVNHINRRLGDYVTSNDYVLSVELENSQHYIAARFTTDDARFLKHGEPCKIIIPAGGIVTEGKVVSVGHSGLSAFGAVSLDEETALADTPTKIEFPPEIEIRTGQHVFIKVRRGWTLETWFLRLF
jgi:multidrug resistance efflux pump